MKDCPWASRACTCIITWHPCKVLFFLLFEEMICSTSSVCHRHCFGSIPYHCLITFFSCVAFDTSSYYVSNLLNRGAPLTTLRGRQEKEGHLVTHLSPSILYVCSPDEHRLISYHPRASFCLLSLPPVVLMSHPRGMLGMGYTPERVLVLGRRG